MEGHGVIYPKRSLRLRILLRKRAKDFHEYMGILKRTARRITRISPLARPREIQQLLLYSDNALAVVARAQGIAGELGRGTEVESFENIASLVISEARAYTRAVIEPQHLIQGRRQFIQMLHRAGRDFDEAIARSEEP